MSPGLKRAILIFNTLGFLAYLIWLSRFSTSETMRTQDGIIYYGCASMKQRNYMVFTLTTNGYSYEVVNY